MLLHKIFAKDIKKARRGNIPVGLYRLYERSYLIIMAMPTFRFSICRFLDVV
jgi:hypothetical protein